MIHHIKKLNNKNVMTVSIEAEKALDKIQNPFLIKKKIKPLESGHRGNLPQYNKGHI